MGFGSDLTFGNGDNKSGSGGTGLGMGSGMGDLSEPHVSAGFSDEVALSRRGSHGLDSAVLRVAEIRKPNRSFLLANAVNLVNPAVVKTYQVVHKRICYLLKSSK